jgi:succinyl-CoA synthetase beta subunit
MKLKEYEGKELFKKYGILVPKGKVISKVEKIEGIAKAQVLDGGRGKKGLIKDASEENLKELFKHCKEVLVEEKLDIEKEYYLCLTIDRELKDIVVLFSEEGGIDIEESKNVEKILYSEFNEEKFNDIVKNMHKLMIEENATLVEINPLAKVGKELIALDSKIILDTKEESNYVELDGNIGIIGNGAGLVMATLDSVEHYGGKAANFLDLGGGADNEVMREAIKKVLEKDVKVIFINIFGGITRCDEIARGLVDVKIDIPMIVRIVGTNEKEAKKILEENNIQVCDSMEECAKEAVGV